MLDGPAPPRELAYLLAFLDNEKGEEKITGWFAELSATRQSNGFAPAPISYQEIAAWARLTGRAPLPFEVRLLRALDTALLAATPPAHDDDDLDDDGD